MKNTALGHVNLVRFILALRYPQRKKSTGVRSGGRGGHYVACPRPTTWPGNRGIGHASYHVQWYGGELGRHPESTKLYNAELVVTASNTGLFHYMGHHSPKNANPNFTVEYLRNALSKKLQISQRHVKWPTRSFDTSSGSFHVRVWVAWTHF